MTSELYILLTCCRPCEVDIGMTKGYDIPQIMFSRVSRVIKWIFDLKY